MFLIHQTMCVYQAEMEVVKTGMQHGDLSLDAYTQVLPIFHLCHVSMIYV